MDSFGFARRDITPPVGSLLYGYVDDLASEKIHDRLNANAFWFGGKKDSLMITCDVCSINTEIADKIRQAISDETGIDSDCIILHAIHNHTGPNTDGNTGWGQLDMPYCLDILLPACVEASKEAKENAAPAKMGFAMGESIVGVNRRETDINNNVIFGQRPWGCFDPRMAVITFRNALTDSIIASLVFYTCHGTCAGICREISRDFSGGMIDILEKHTGAPAAFFCGAEGDVGPRLDNHQTVGCIHDVEIMGERAGRDAVKIFDTIREYVPLETKTVSGELEMPLKSRIPLSEAQEIYDFYKNESVNLEGQKRSYAIKVMDSYKNSYEEIPYRKISQTAIALGNILFVAFPYELFSEIALRINKEVKDFEVFSLSDCNGSAGYFPTHCEIPKGGYEIDMFLTLNVQPFCDNADFHLIKETLKNLEALKCTE